jgi:hypothetical protein
MCRPGDIDDFHLLRVSPEEVIMKAWEIWNTLLEKSLDAMTKAEGNIRRTNVFLADFEMGGWLYNISPAAGEGRIWSALRDTAKSIKAIGAPSVANRLVQIADIVERADVRTAGKWKDHMAKVDPENRIRELEQAISGEIPNLWAKLEEYTGRHFDIEPD